MSNLGNEALQLNTRRKLRKALTRPDLYAPAPALVDNEASSFALREYLAIFRRRRAILLQSFLLVVAVGTVVTLLTKPVYVTSAKLLVEGTALNINSVDTANPLSSLFAIEPTQDVDTQVEVLQTAPLLEQVAQQAGPAKLKVQSIPGTNVIEVDSEANDPRVAANAANTLLKLYVASTDDQELSDIRNSRDFAASEGAKAHRQLTAAEDAIMAFKQKNHLTDLSQNQFTVLTSVGQLTDANQSDWLQLTALQKSIAENKRLLKSEPETILIPLKATNTRIDVLRDQIAALQVKVQSETQPGGFTNKAPQVIADEAQITALQSQLASQPALATTVQSSANPQRDSLHAKIVDEESAIPALESNIRQRNVTLANLKLQTGKFAQWEVSLARLLRTQTEAEAMDKMFADKVALIALREKAYHPSARIIESAEVPHYPVRPKKLTGVFFSVLLGLFIGSCLALLQEFVDDRINSVADAERLLQLPSLGQIPSLSVSDARVLPLVSGFESESESYRILRTNIRFASLDAPLRTIMIGSSTSGEGKTTTTANLAFAMALDGKKVIVVDGDLRRPNLHRRLEVESGPGLTDVLLGRISLERALITLPELHNLQFLQCGSLAPNPGEVLGSTQFENLLMELRSRADVVILDSSPLLVAADAAILASLTDGVVLVIEPGETKKAVALQAVKILRHVRARLVGVTFNRVQTTGMSYAYQYRTIPQHDQRVVQSLQAEPPELVYGGREKTLIISTDDLAGHRSNLEEE
ncbi:MAG: GumC family protein [Capsulimonadaceae bacterium]